MFILLHVSEFEYKYWIIIDISCKWGELPDEKMNCDAKIFIFYEGLITPKWNWEFCLFKNELKIASDANHCEKGCSLEYCTMNTVTYVCKSIGMLIR